jgi:hypothetical protein
MKFPTGIDVYGDKSFRGKCATESLEQVTFFARLRRDYPNSWGKIAFHPRNEGFRTAMKVKIEKAEGMVTGTPDIIIPGDPTFVCELKRRDHTKSSLQDGQKDYLYAAQEAGGFVCIALGHKAAREAFGRYLAIHYTA